MAAGGVTAAEIIRDCAAAWDVPIEEVTGPGRPAHVVLARHLAMALIRAVFPSYSFSAVAALLSRADHGAAMHGIRSVMDAPEVSRQKKLFRALLQRYGITGNNAATTIT